MDRIKLVKYYKEPTERYNIISVSVFRLSTVYKPAQKYYQGLDELASSFQKYFLDMYLRIYYDNSVIEPTHEIESINTEVREHWIPLFDKLKKMEHVQLIKYEHPDFTKDKIYHDGLFGTFVRFIPLFDYEGSKNLGLVGISDIDVSRQVLEAFSDQFKEFKNHPEVKLFFRTKYCYNVRDRYFKVENKLDERYRVKVWHRLLAGTIFCRMKFPKYLLEDFINCMLNLDTDSCKFINHFLDVETTGYLSKQKLELKKSTNFIYGIDEFFLNTTFLKYVVDNKITFAWSSFQDITTPLYNWFLRNNKLYNENPNHKEFMKSVLGKYYDETKSLNQNYNFFDRNVYMKYYKNRKDDPNSDRYIYMFDNLKNKMKEILEQQQFKKYDFFKEEVKCIIRHADYYYIQFKVYKYKNIE